MEEWAQRSIMTVTVELARVTPVETFEVVELSKEISRWQKVVKSLDGRVMDAEAVLDDAKSEKKAAEDRLQELMQQFEGQKSKRKAAVLDEAILNSPVPAAAAVLSSVEAESEQGACSDDPDSAKQ